MAQLEAGRELGPLKILRLLGSGGMADVYEAEDTRLGRHVAVKVLPEEYSRNADFIARFEREVKASAALSHTNIVTVFEFGKFDNLNYYTMRLLPGGDLRAKIAKGMSLVEILKTMRGVLQAFQHAHSRGFVHRDVKPENIMFDDQDTPTLTDFGIAKALDSHTRMTQTGMAVGTPRYISPEQAMGQEVDGRSDLYSLGCILYEMLTGQVPFKADTPIATIFQHVNEPIPQLDEEFGIFQDLLNTLMAKDPNDRLQDAQSTLALLDQTFPSDWTGTFDVSRLTGNQAAVEGSHTPASTPIRAHTVDKIPAKGKKQPEAPLPDQSATQVAPVPPPAEGATQLLQATPVVDAEAGEAAKTQFVDAPRPKAKAPDKKARKAKPRSTKPAARAERSGPPWALIIIALLLIGVGAAWFLGAGTDGDEAPPAEQPSPTPVATPEPTQTRTPAEDEEAKALQDRRRQIEEQRRLQVLEERRKREEAEQKAQEEAQRKAQAEAQRKADEEAQRKADAEAKRKADAEAKRKADAEAKRKADEAAKAKAAEDARRKEAEQQKAREDELRRQRELNIQRQREEDARRAREAEAARLQREANERRAREEAAQKEAETSKSEDDQRKEELKKPVPIGF